MTLTMTYFQGCHRDEDVCGLRDIGRVVHVVVRDVVVMVLQVAQVGH